MSFPGREGLFQLVSDEFSDDPETVTRFRELLVRSGEEDGDAFLEEVDQSDYSLRDWVEALLVFDAWLAGRGERDRPFRAMIGYVHCCTLMNAPTISLPSLKVSVFESLTEFGFEAVSESQK